MTCQVRFTKAAEEDLVRLYELQLSRSAGEWALAGRALEAIRFGIESLSRAPFSCRKAVTGNPFLRELIIPFGAAGYVALFEVENEQIVTVLAIRHEREDDYH